MTGKWKADFNRRGEMSLFQGGDEVASGMRRVDAEDIAKRLNHYKSVVSSLRRIRFQIDGPDTFTSDEAHQVLVDILAGANDTLKNIGESE